jgi:hypothetical protein
MGVNIENYKLYNKGIIFRGAPHAEQKLTKTDCKVLMKRYSGLFVRNICDFDSTKETSFWFIIKDSFKGMDEMKSKMRNQIRKAQNSLDIQPVSKEYFLENGYDVYLESYTRYKEIRDKPLAKELWIKQINDSNINNTEYWGAITKETQKLIAYGVNLIQDNICKYTTLKAIPEYLNQYYPFYGLIYAMNEYYLAERKMLYVTDGARSITEHSNIQSFLDKFNFRKAYCSLTIIYHPLLKVIIGILYPFRKKIPIKEIKYLLNFEAMQRGEI